jgi:hypothetical protein
MPHREAFFTFFPDQPREGRPKKIPLRAVYYTQLIRFLLLSRVFIRSEPIAFYNISAEAAACLVLTRCLLSVLLCGGPL